MRDGSARKWLRGRGAWSSHGLRACLALLGAWGIGWALGQTPGTPLADARSEFVSAEQALHEAMSEAMHELPIGTAVAMRGNYERMLGYRDDRARARAVIWDDATEGEEEASVEYWQSLTVTTRTWTPWLQAAVATYGTHGERVDGNTPEAWNGRWVDGYGGVLTLTGVNATTLAFNIEIVRGRDYATGQLEGEATFDPASRTAVFSTTVDVGTEVVYTLLDFAFLDGGVNVTGTNTLPYHGFGAYFDGRYLRVPDRVARE